VVLLWELLADSLPEATVSGSILWHSGKRSTLVSPNSPDAPIHISNAMGAASIFMRWLIMPWWSVPHLNRVGPGQGNRGTLERGKVFQFFVALEERH